MLEVGATGHAELIVQESDTARELAPTADDEFPPVLATSRMVALMEVAAARAMKSEVPPGRLSVGVSLDIRHTAASPIGARVRARATYLGREGKLYRFHVEAFDDGGPVGSGEHRRAIVDVERLVTEAKKRAGVKETA